MNNNNNNNNFVFYVDTDDTTSMNTSLIETDLTDKISDNSELHFSEDFKDILDFINNYNDNYNNDDILTPEGITMILAISSNFIGVPNSSFKQKIHNNKKFIN